jgi:ribonuclease Y
VEWILAAAVVAAFVLGVMFIAAYRKRGGPAPIPRVGPLNLTESGAGRSGGGLRDLAEGEIAPDSDANRQADSYAASTRRLADAEAASTKQLAEREAETLRRAADAEAASIVRAARREVALAEQAARALTEQAEQAAGVIADRAAQRGVEIERGAADAARSREAEQASASLALDRRQSDLDARDAELARRRELVAAGEQDLADRATDLDLRSADLDRRAEEIGRRQVEHEAELARICGLTKDEARAELMHAVEISSRREAALLARSIESEARTEANQRARSIIVEAVQRCASDQTAETVVSVMHLPSDEMKGRIIGREGRNIRSFEAVTGVNVVIDDTPEAVLLSCFDPTRREIGRLTLEKLILDGRIHPHRIEEAYEQSKIEVDELCLRAAADALADVGITDIDERLLPVLGRLKYRTSYGQNVLGHLVETAHISGVMAGELGIAPELIKRCAFLHDIGKALTHEVQGSHAIIGAELLRRHGESELVAHAVEAHHNEVPPHTVEAVLTQASDACSAARPGARRETLESYITRLHRIEEIANTKTGVEKVFAMQAGREVRVMVHPESIDDLAAQVMAREIAKQIEDELTYPGQIRVTVVRESRATETAH